MSIEYSKIDTLFERDPTTFVVDPTKLKHPVFGMFKEWDVTEKVDGTNIRVDFLPGAPAGIDTVGAELVPVPPVVYFNGRTNNAKTPEDLLANLAKMFPAEKFTPHFQTPVTLYGEGYGAGIQKCGGGYRGDKSFILFDVLVDGKWWLNTKQVQEVAKSLDIRVVPFLGRYSLDEIITMCQQGMPSMIPGCAEGQRSEGIVARPIETLFDSRGNRVILKLKTKDFVAGKR